MAAVAELKVLATVPPLAPVRPIATYFRFASTYWSGATARGAWGATIAIAVVMGATLAVNLGHNYWNRWFFDALEKRNAADVLAILIWMPVLIAVGTCLAVLMIRLKMGLQVGWRRFVTERMLALWLGNQRYYRLSLAHNNLENAEYRIAEDVRLATEPVVEMTVGFAWSLISALAFVGVLMSVGGSVSVFGMTIPGYMALAAVLYAVLIGSATFLIGRPLANLVASKNETEAQLRYEMTRVRENAESIALMHGDAREQAQTRGKLGEVVTAWMELVHQYGRLTFVSSTSSWLSPVVPALLAAPKYLAGELTLGAVMQLIAAFSAVLGALNWFADNYTRLAELVASARRVEELRIALLALDGIDADARLSSLAVGTSAGSAIELQNVSLDKRDGSALLGSANLRILAGQRVLIEGKSGSGKSTLLRALAGLWPWGAGRIRLPAGAKVAFIPQRPYIPLGKLRDALIYPASDTQLDDVQTAAIFEKIGLGHFIARLQDTDNWDRILSGGERQRLAFGRLLIHRPDIIVLDEATSALDDDAQGEMFALLSSELPQATVLNVAHRKGLDGFHDRRIVIDQSGDVAILSSTSLKRSGRLLGLLRNPRGRAEPAAPADTESQRKAATADASTGS
jgi:vitamin B12/bleomycin/antimicrobial peptide transport system ATP-binding/permease protein